MNAGDLLEILHIGDKQIPFATPSQGRDLYISVDDSHPILRLGIASNIEEAKVLLSNNRYDLILLDLDHPEDSMESLKQLRLQFPYTPVMVVTCCWCRDSMVKAVQHGAQDYLVKEGLTRETLVRAIAQAIERHKREVALKTATAKL